MRVWIWARVFWLLLGDRCARFSARCGNPYRCRGVRDCSGGGVRAQAAGRRLWAARGGGCPAVPLGGGGLPDALDSRRAERGGCAGHGRRRGRPRHHGRRPGGGPARTRPLAAPVHAPHGRAAGAVWVHAERAAGLGHYPAVQTSLEARELLALLLLLMVAGVLMGAFAASSSRGSGFELTMAVFVTAGVVLMLLFMEEAPPLLATAVELVGYYCFEVAIWSTLALVAHRHQGQFAFVYGLGSGLYCGPVCLLPGRERHRCAVFGRGDRRAPSSRWHSCSSCC